MKKTGFILLLVVLSIQTYSQRGDLSVGVKGGFLVSTEYYKDFLYGIDVAYHLNDPIEVAFTGLMNPNISSYKNYQDKEQKLAAYSANLDFRVYLVRVRDWANFATGPALGGQFYLVNNKTANLGADKALGFNIGWHARINLTDNVKVNGGWRYTNAKTKDRTNWWNDSLSFDMSHHFFNLGIAYTFELK